MRKFWRRRKVVIDLVDRLREDPERLLRQYHVEATSVKTPKPERVGVSR